MQGKDSELANELVKEIKRNLSGEIKLMEVCGTHTVAIFRSGIKTLLPGGIKLLSGPGCPVCVTSIEDVDMAIAISRESGVILATFGDMMRVPGSTSFLNKEKAKGQDIRIIYSPLDCLKIAEFNPSKKVVFFATGFETTSPSVAATVVEAQNKGIKNFYILSVHKLVPPALSALLQSGDVKIGGFILPGHVSAIIGTNPYEFIPSRFNTPGVVTGFEPLDILEAIYMLVNKIKDRTPDIDIQYKRVVKKEGNPKAVGMMEKVFEPTDSKWRGIGIIPLSGLKLRDEFSSFAAEKIFNIKISSSKEPAGCSCGEVLRGIKIPTECKLFGNVCTPERPVGACMVSTEGSCSAYYRYGGYING